MEALRRRLGYRQTADRRPCGGEVNREVRSPLRDRKLTFTPVAQPDRLRPLTQRCAAPRRFLFAVGRSRRASGEDAIASPGNANNLYIVVSVVDLNGAAVAGLAIGNFSLGSEIVGPGGSISHINTVTSGQ